MTWLSVPTDNTEPHALVVVVTGALDSRISLLQHNSFTSVIVGFPDFATHIHSAERCGEFFHVEGYAM